MASNQVDTSDEVDFSVFGVEFPRLISFLHLQENLIYVQGDRPIAPDLMYHIMSANIVLIRSTYSLNSHTLLVDLNVPTGELDFDLTLDIITAC